MCGILQNVHGPSGGDRLDSFLYSLAPTGVSTSLGVSGAQNNTITGIVTILHEHKQPRVNLLKHIGQQFD